MSNSSVPFPPKQILVVSNCTRDSAEVVHQAMIMARISGAAVTVCRIIPASLQSDDFGACPDASWSGALSPRLARATQELADHLFSVLGDAADRLRLRAGIGDTDAAVVKIAKELGSDLLVVGADDVSSQSLSIPGALADSVVQNADCSVLVVRSIHCNRLVLTATDFSEYSVSAIVAADTIARQTRARLIVVHSIDLGVPSDTEEVPHFAEGVPSAWKTARAKARSIAENRLTALLHGLRVKGEGRVFEGSAADAVLNTAKAMQPALLVIGAHGRARPARVPVGSVAEEVVRCAGCQVLIVR